MAVLPLKKIVEAGLDVSANLTGATVATNFQNIRGKTVLLVKNANAASDVVTIDGNPDIAVTIPTTEQRLIGPFDENFEDSSGFVLVAHSITPSVDSMAAHLGEK